MACAALSSKARSLCPRSGGAATGATGTALPFRCGAESPCLAHGLRSRITKKSLVGFSMRKTIVALVVIGLVWIGYMAWPLYEFTALVRAIDARDISTVARYVNFDRVRASLTEEIASGYIRRSGVQPGPLAQQAIVVGLSVADPVIRKLVSPEALSELLAVGWPVAVAPSARRSRTKQRYARNCLAGFWRVSLWPSQVRSVSAYRTAAGKPLSATVPAPSVALATGRHHPSREHSEFASG